MSSLPLGLNGIEIQRGMTTSSTAIFVPFMTQELCMDGEAVYYGLNALSHNVIMADRKKLKNPRAMKADAELRYQQAAAEHPELQSSPLSRMAQKWKIKRQYAKKAREAARQGAKATGKAAGTVEKAAEKLALFVRNHKGGAVVVLLGQGFQPETDGRRPGFFAGK